MSARTPLCKCDDAFDRLYYVMSMLLMITHDLPFYDLYCCKRLLNVLSSWDVGSGLFGLIYGVEDRPSTLQVLIMVNGIWHLPITLLALHSVEHIIVWLLQNVTVFRKTLLLKSMWQKALYVNPLKSFLPNNCSMVLNPNPPKKSTKIISVIKKIIQFQITQILLVSPVRL